MRFPTEQDFRDTRYKFGSENLCIVCYESSATGFILCREHYVAWDQTVYERGNTVQFVAWLNEMGVGWLWPEWR